MPGKSSKQSMKGKRNLAAANESRSSNNPPPGFNGSESDGDQSEENGYLNSNNNMMENIRRIEDINTPSAIDISGVLVRIDKSFTITHLRDIIVPQFAKYVKNTKGLRKPAMTAIQKLFLDWMKEVAKFFASQLFDSNGSHRSSPARKAFSQQIITRVALNVEKVLTKMDYSQSSIADCHHFIELALEFAVVNASKQKVFTFIALLNYYLLNLKTCRSITYESNADWLNLLNLRSRSSALPSGWKHWP